MKNLDYAMLHKKFNLNKSLYFSVLQNIYRIGFMLTSLTALAPLQGNYSEGLPSPGPGENRSIKELVKGAGQIPWKRVMTFCVRNM